MRLQPIRGQRARKPQEEGRPQGGLFREAQGLSGVMLEKDSEGISL